MNAFAEMVKQRRFELRIGLREFCQACNLDPSNWSKIERGLASPPKDKNVIDLIRKTLKYKANSKEAQILADNAAIGAGTIPADLLKDANIAPRLPLFFRAIRGEKHTDSELRKLVEIIREAETPE